MKSIVILSGSGISAESGIPTYRADDAIWKKYDPGIYATHAGLRDNPQDWLDFYNLARKEVLKAEPNKGHFDIAKLEEDFDVTIVTQNVDDLHERAGSTKYMHVHGTLLQCRSVKDEKDTYPYDKDLTIEDKSPKNNSQLRPDVVLFGELVKYQQEAYQAIYDADYLIVTGTSLNVFPVNGFISTFSGTKAWIVDPNPPTTENLGVHYDFEIIKESASTGIEKIHNELKENDK